MREIKFRAFSKLNNKYVDWYENDEITIFDLNNGHDMSVFGDCIAGACNEYILEQYTGLKDKNGKEIYEGDIMQDNCLLKSEIIFELGSFCHKSNNGDIVPMWKGTYLHQFEIIGNIHENPELLV